MTPYFSPLPQLGLFPPNFRFSEISGNFREIPGAEIPEIFEMPGGTSKSQISGTLCTPTSTLDEQKCTLFRKKLSVLEEIGNPRKKSDFPKVHA